VESLSKEISAIWLHVSVELLSHRAVGEEGMALISFFYICIVT